ncbi:MAG: ATP-binding protein [Halobaculum sp.]
MAGDRERRRERLRRYLTEVVTGENVALIDELFGDLVTERRWGSDFDSLEAVKDYHEEMAGHFEDFSVDVESVIVEGDEAAARGVASGRTVKDWFEVIPAGHEFEFRISTHAVFDEEDLMVDVPSYFDTLALLPESSRYAHRSLVTEVEDAVVVLDEDERITELNEAATAAFAPEREPSTLIGEPLTDLLGSDADLPAVGDRAEFASEIDGRTFEVRVSALENVYDEVIGRALVFRDVSERKRREQKLQVLNRVLRHNLRNELNVIQGFHQKIAARSDETIQEFVSRAETATESLLSTAATARNVQTDLSGGTQQQQEITSTVHSLARRAREEYPDATVVTRTAGETLVTAREALDTALWELLENACEHTDPGATIEISVETPDESEQIEDGTPPHVDDERGAADTDSTVTVTISDDGPGIPDSEVAVIETGTETQVRHGSGLGLWFASWVVDASGGDIEIDTDDGTTVTITLPAAES